MKALMNTTIFARHFKCSKHEKAEWSYVVHFHQRAGRREPRTQWEKKKRDMLESEVIPG
jgi:hypothetical protein